MATLRPVDDADDPRPPPKDLTHHLSRVTRNRKASSMKAFYKYFTIPGIGQIAGGLPNNYYFPFDTLEAKVARADRWKPTPNRPVDPPRDDDDEAAECVGKLGLGMKLGMKSSPLNQPQDALIVPHTSQQPNPLKKIDLSTALQYGTAQGYPPLYYFIRQFTQQHMHPNCPYQGGPEVILTCGNTDGFAKVLQLLVDDWDESKDCLRDRPSILVESFCYMNAVQSAVPRGMAVAPVAIDDEGMLADGPGGLRDVLENWDEKQARRPHLMYTVAMGQNPTSGVLSLQRRREIYALASKYDIIIVEDEPYWFLQFPTATATKTTTTTTASTANTWFNPHTEMFANGEPRPDTWKSSGYEFLDSLVPSYISIDTDGRVIRLDTFSKTVAPGCRLGWITAQPALVERILRITETSTQQPSGFVQSLVSEIVLGPDSSGLDQNGNGKRGGPRAGAGWTADGWVRWLEGLRGNYERRMNSMAKILDDGNLLVRLSGRADLCTTTDDPVEQVEEEWSVIETKRLYSFAWPVGGMFLWLRVHFASHPLWAAYAADPARLSRALWVFWTTAPYRVLVSPGSIFSPTDAIRDGEGWKYFRLCFAAVDEGVLGPVTRSIVEGARAFFRIRAVRVIEELVEGDERGGGGGGAGAGVACVHMGGPC